MSLGKKWFSTLTQVGAEIGVPVKLVCLHFTNVVVPAPLPCSLPFVSVETWPDGCLVERGLVILLFECVVEGVFCCVLCTSSFFPTWCLCLDIYFIDSLPLYSYFIMFVS